MFKTRSQPIFVPVGGSVQITARDLFWSYAAQFLNVGVGILVLPLVLRVLEAEELAVWYVFLTVQAFVLLLNLGFPNSIMRSVAYAWAGVREIPSEGLADAPYTSDGPNFELLAEIIAGVRRIYAIVAGISFVVLSTAGTVYILSVVGHEYLRTRSMFAWGLFVVGTSLTLFYGYFDPLLRGVGRVKESQKVAIAVKVTQLSLTYILLALDAGLIGLSVATGVAVLLGRQIARIYIRRGIPRSVLNAGPGHSAVARAVGRMWPNAFRLGLSSLGAFLVARSGTLVVASSLPLATTASFGLTLQLLSAIQVFSLIPLNAILPQLNRIRIQRNTTDLLERFGVVLLIARGTFLAAAVAVCLLGPQLLRALGSKSTLLPVPMVGLMGISGLLETNHVAFATLISTENRIPFGIAGLVSGIAVAVLSVALVSWEFMGIWGVLIARFIVQAAYNNWRWPLYVHRSYGLRHVDLLVFTFRGLTHLSRRIALLVGASKRTVNRKEEG